MFKIFRTASNASERDQARQCKVQQQIVAYNNIPTYLSYHILSHVVTKTSWGDGKKSTSVSNKGNDSTRCFVYPPSRAQCELRHAGRWIDTARPSLLDEMMASQAPLDDMAASWEGSNNPADTLRACVVEMYFILACSGSWDKNTGRRGRCTCRQRRIHSRASWAVKEYVSSLFLVCFRTL